MAPDRLTALDTSFLRTETPTAHMHVAWRGRFAPAPRDPPITVARVRTLIGRRLLGAPRFRQRLAFPPAGLREPVWIDDERFAIERHVLALAGDEDGREPLPLSRFDELADLALSSPLARDRALWTLHVAPRLVDGTTGILMRVHHAMVDGMSALSLALLLLDTERDPNAGAGGLPAAPEPTWRPARTPTGARLAVDALAASGTEPLRAAGRVARLAATPSGRSRISDTLRRTALAVGEDVLTAAPPSFLNTTIGPRRTLVGHRTPIAGLLDIKRARRVSLNDVALAVVAGALRRLARDSGAEPAELKIMVPVSRREGPDAVAPGNRIAFVFVSLPLHLERPLARLEAIRSETHAFKSSGRALGGEALLAALGALPGPLQARAARIGSSARMYNLVVSNVPGPRVPVYLLGAECVEAMPVIPLSEDHALSIGVFSLQRAVCFSGYADPGVLPGIAGLPGALETSISELMERASPQRAPRPVGRERRAARPRQLAGVRNT